MARKTYTREFKVQALRMVTGQGLSVAEVARRLGVHVNLLRSWKKAAGPGTDAFPGHGKPGPACSENTVAALMKTHGIRAKAPRRFVRTTDSRHGLPVADNVLDRGFDPDWPNAAWSAEIV